MMFMDKGNTPRMGSNDNSVASNGVAGDLMNPIMQDRAPTNMGNSSTPNPLGAITMNDSSIGGESFSSAQQMGGGLGAVNEELMRNAFGEPMPKNGLFGQ